MTIETTVRKIVTNDATFLARSTKKLEVTVEFTDNAEQYETSAVVLVWLDKRDAPLSELKDEAIKKATDFLRAALESRP